MRRPEACFPATHGLCVVVAASLLLVGIPGAAADEAPRRWRGNFLVGSHGAQMSPCGSGERVDVEDASPGRTLEAAYRELTLRARRPIFIEFEGTRIGEKRVRAHLLTRAYSVGPGCRERLDNIRLRAFALEPFWQLEIRDDAVLLRTAPSAEPVRFPPGVLHAPADRPAERVYEGANPGSVLKVEVRPERCYDTLSSAVFGYRANARLNERSFSGCAYWGDLEPLH